MSYKKIILLYGPTASGKSKLAVDIAKNFNGEIVNVISTQIDEQTWYLEGDIKYEITYDKDLKWTGLKFNADEDDIIEYICKNCK